MPGASGCEGLGPESAAAELVEGLLAREQQTQQDQRQRQKADKGIVCCGIELDVAIDAVGVVAEGIKHLDDARDGHEETEHDDDVEADDGPAEEGVPPETRVLGAHEALQELEVDDVDDQGAGGDEDCGGDGQTDVVWE